MRNPQTLRFWRGRLPHWEVEDGNYFITLRLAGSLPVALRRELEAFLVDIEADAYQEKMRGFFLKMEAWLDHDRELDCLVQPTMAEMLMTAFREYEFRSIWKLHCFVIMPNHLHWFCRPLDRSLTEAIRHFKRFTARKANEYLGTAGKRFWQLEWFDHWSRSTREDEKIMHYIRNNPVKAGLTGRVEKWPYVG